MDMKKMFGQRLREVRTAKMLTQETIAELIDIQPENYSRIENGLSFPKPENLLKISKVLDVEIAELFQFSHLNDYDKILDSIIEKLKNDKDTTVITYKFLKSIGKLWYDVSMVKSDIIKIKKIENFDNNYIENEISKSGKSLLRWAIVDIDDEYLTVSVSYI